jgi:hypothetical protein
MIVKGGAGNLPFGKFVTQTVLSLRTGAPGHLVRQEHQEAARFDPNVVRVQDSRALSTSNSSLPQKSADLEVIVGPYGRAVGRLGWWRQIQLGGIFLELLDLRRAEEKMSALLRVLSATDAVSQRPFHFL